jgi:predicted transcriptional regulator
MPRLAELITELETVQLKIDVIEAGARRRAIGGIRSKMAELGLTTHALRKRLLDDPFGPPPRSESPSRR